MTSLAKIRTKIKNVEKEVQSIKQEFAEVAETLSKTTKPLGNKKEKSNGTK